PDRRRDHPRARQARAHVGDRAGDLHGARPREGGHVRSDVPTDDPDAYRTTDPRHDVLDEEARRIAVRRMLEVADEDHVGLGRLRPRRRAEVARVDAYGADGDAETRQEAAESRRVLRRHGDYVVRPRGGTQLEVEIAEVAIERDGGPARAASSGPPLVACGCEAELV